MERIQIGGQEVLVGLDWDHLDGGVSERRALTNVLNSDNHKGQRLGVIVRGPEDGSVGLAPANAKLPGKIPSAAAWLARAAQVRMHSGSGDSEVATTDAASWNWVVIEKIDDDLFWMVAIYKGVPVPTTDILGSYEVVIAQGQQFQGMGDFTVHSTDPHIRDSLSIGGPVHPSGFAALVENMDETSIKQADLWLKQVKGLRLPLFLGAMVTLLLLGGLIVGLHIHSVHLAEMAAAKRAAAAAANQREITQARTKYEADVQLAVYKALEEGKKQVDQALVSPPPSLIIDQWTKLVGAVNLDQSTWQLSKVHCIGGKVPTCEVSLTRGDMGVNRLLLADHPDAQIDGDKASYTMAGATLANRPADWSRLADARSFMVDLLSDLQLLRNAAITYHQEPSKEVVHTVDMPKTTSEKFKPGSTEKVGPAPVVQMGVATGKLGLGSSQLWQLIGLGEFLDHDGIILHDLDVSMDATGVSNWKINADYLIRSKPQPVMPTILSEGKPLPLTLPKAYADMHQATGGVGGSDGEAASLESTPASASTAGTAPTSALPPPPPPPPATPVPTQRF